jgi:hypothetical protein
MRRLILLTAIVGEDLERLVQFFGGDVEVAVARALNDLSALSVDAGTSLISFGSGVIVPAEILSTFVKPAYNMHAASPEFPGRDPHHHATYRGAREYGATLHLMTPRVDAGPIVATEIFSVPSRATPADLLAAANEAGFRLFQQYGPRLLDPSPLPPLPNVSWGRVKTRRSDLQRFCALSPLISANEFARRYRAFDGSEYENLTVELHGRTFRIDKRNPAPKTGTSSFADFTEEAFRELLRQLKRAGYRFARFGAEANAESRGLKTDRHVLWRHDVDFSMHRAAKLAEIEAEEGAIATYFVNPRCMFYNLLEPGIAAQLDRIRSLGHEIGLHFDASAYATSVWSRDELDKALTREQTVLESILGSPIRCVSWHNPDLSNLLDFQCDELCGLVSAYSASLHRNYVYCSDSNGYWRFQPMVNVIAEGHPRLHLLTHPEWWTREAMSPAARLERAILGRARATYAHHCSTIEQGDRRHITDQSETPPIS